MKLHWQRLSSGAIGAIGDTIGTRGSWPRSAARLTMLDDVMRQCQRAEIPEPLHPIILSKQYSVLHTLYVAYQIHKDTSPADCRYNTSNRAKAQEADDGVNTKLFGGVWPQNTVAGWITGSAPSYSIYSYGVLTDSPWRTTERRRSR